LAYNSFNGPNGDTHIIPAPAEYLKSPKEIDSFFAYTDPASKNKLALN
jgi:hypothetical protein